MSKISTKLESEGINKLLQQDDFIQRHIGPNNDQVQQMLEAVGVKDLEQLINETVPDNIRLQRDLALEPPCSEPDALDYLKDMMSANKLNKSLLGLGYYPCHTPPVILRNFLENPGWYTAYTPYQAEISQGRLELLLNYQQMIVDLTGMECSNASLLDEATAAAEAMALAKRTAGNKGNKFFASKKCFLQTLDLLRTRSAPLGIELVIGDIKEYEKNPADYFGVLVRYPDMSGEITDWADLATIAHDNKALLCMATDLLALVLLKSPGSMGADIVFGNSQRFGVPLGFGGPHAAFFAVNQKQQRSMPGRLIGVSVDAKGKRALRMALQTREQHIRRDKATSNICTAQVLLANIASLYACYHGYEGLATIATRVHRLTSIVSKFLKEKGYDLATDNFFDTLSILPSSGANLKEISAKAEEQGYNFLLLKDSNLQMSFDETTSPSDLVNILKVFGCSVDEDTILATGTQGNYNFNQKHLRTDEILTHPVFNQYRTETNMMRYLRKLQQKDIGLDRSMIALGSCTMKLNAASEMIPISWEKINGIHPIAPKSQIAGYDKFLEEFEGMLKEITGFDAISFQPNSGAQGEYAGLLAIRSYHLSRKDKNRDVCLIPSSAHGTNPASAVMAGMKVVVVECDDKGNVNVQDMQEKIAANEGAIAALMITYPSTHGVFESSIMEICELIHQAGGLVYMDGANLNAMVGIARPADIGADVCHMNLHKTFCIPHGGGGPGMGPIGVVHDLAEFLPKHWSHVAVDAVGTELNSVSGAPYGSASILPISWAYIKMMGASGLTYATKIAILNANYIAVRLENHYPVLYKGEKGRNAHECIFDIRDIKKSSGISEEDIAKRLIDYGFHAPTMSFPVAGTLMVEPTESESKDEIDRFCDAMISIREEIDAVEKGKSLLEDNPLVNAPHNLSDLYSDWKHPYTKEQAFYPLPYLQEDKYFSPVNRVNNPHGDKNLLCVCPPMEDYT